MSFKDKLARVEIEDLEKMMQQESGDTGEPESSGPPEPPKYVYCGECDCNTEREEHDALVCNHCMAGPFCAGCWNKHLRRVHPEIESVLAEARTRPAADLAAGMQQRQGETKPRDGRSFRWRFVVAAVLAVCGLLVLLAAPRPERQAEIHAPSPPAVVGNKQPGTLPLDLVAITSPIARGNTASLTVATQAAATCSIEVRYRSGPSKASGLEPKTSDANGRATWSWRVGKQTAAGDWPITATCASGDGEAILNARFVVTE